MIYKVFLDKKNCNCWPEILLKYNFASYLKTFTDIAFDTNYQFVDTYQECNTYVIECSRLRYDIILPTDKLCLILCGESDTLYKYTNVMECYKDNLNVKFIGTVSDTNISFHFPLLNRTYLGNDLYTLKFLDNEKLPTFNKRLILHNIIPCFMRKMNKNYAIIKSMRENLAKEFEVDYVNGQDKLTIICQYLINFCAENSLSLFGGDDGYITEKVYLAAAAKCIPLYFGGDIQKYTILNHERILKINGHTKFSLTQLKNMSIDQLEYIYNLPVLRHDYVEFVENRKKKLKEFINRR